MATEIQDGTGKGYRAQVDSDKRLHVNSVSRTQLEQATILGEAYNINTGSITLTSANESAVGYIKHTGSEPLIISEIIVIIGATTGGSGDGVVKVIKNPTAGTLVANAVAMDDIQNRDFSSSKILEVLAYKGVEGDTITDGVEFSTTTRSAFGTVVRFDAAQIVLKKGNSIAVTYTPPASNTSQSVTVAGTVFIETATVSGDLSV